jgi:hypothetical protein
VWGGLSFEAIDQAATACGTGGGRCPRLRARSSVRVRTVRELITAVEIDPLG